MQTESYVVLRPFMVEELGLKGSELVAYALIYGFSQDGESWFTGSAQYVADWELDAIEAERRESAEESAAEFRKAVAKREKARRDDEYAKAHGMP